MISNSKLFRATKEPLQIFNGQAILDIGLEFVYDNCGTETDFDFPDYVSSYLKIYNERLGRTLKTIPLTRSGNILIVNSTDTSFDDNGDYWYEVIYMMSGGYEQVLRYGVLVVV